MNSQIERTRYLDFPPVGGASKGGKERKKINSNPASCDRQRWEFDLISPGASGGKSARVVDVKSDFIGGGRGSSCGQRIHGRNAEARPRAISSALRRVLSPLCAETEIDIARGFQALLDLLPWPVVIATAAIVSACKHTRRNVHGNICPTTVKNLHLRNNENILQKLEIDLYCKKENIGDRA